MTSVSQILPNPSYTLSQQSHLNLHNLDYVHVRQHRQKTHEITRIRIRARVFVVLLNSSKLITGQYTYNKMGHDRFHLYGNSFLIIVSFDGGNNARNYKL
jgi:hypothetical protein